MKHEIKLGDSRKLCLEQNSDSDYSFEMFIWVENAAGKFETDIAYVASDYEYDGDGRIVQKEGYRVKALSTTDPYDFEDVENPDGDRSVFPLKRTPEQGMVPIGENVITIPLNNGYDIAARVVQDENEVYVGVVHEGSWWQNLLRLRLRYVSKTLLAPDDPDAYMVRLQVFSEGQREYMRARAPIVLKNATKEEAGAEA